MPKERGVTCQAHLAAKRQTLNHTTALEKAITFIHGLLRETRRFTHAAHFRRDPLVPELLGIRRVASGRRPTVLSTLNPALYLWAAAEAATFFTRWQPRISGRSLRQDPEGSPRTRSS